MTPENARILAHAIARLGSPDDRTALAAARAASNLIAAEGVKPNAFASAMTVVLTRMTRPRACAGFPELGPRGARKRLAELSKRRGIGAEDRDRVMEVRERLSADRSLRLTSEEIAWLDALDTRTTEAADHE